jgi:hypothetical protein
MRFTYMSMALFIRCDRRHFRRCLIGRSTEAHVEKPWDGRTLPDVKARESIVARSEL